MLGKTNQYRWQTLRQDCLRACRLFAYHRPPKFGREPRLDADEFGPGSGAKFFIDKFLELRGDRHSQEEAVRLASYDLFRLL